MSLKSGWLNGLDLPALSDLPRFVIDTLTFGAALFTAYMVIGGIWTGNLAILAGTHPSVPLALLGIVIVLIGGLEGLQISVSNLQKKDLTELNRAFPGAYKLHELFKNNEEVMKRFFGGRQFLIVALIFIASRLTTYPHMQTFPFTDVEFPGIMTPWFQFLFLDLGLLGALFVLWLGNLTAQFVAADHPVEFLNFPGMGYLFGLCLCVDKCRLPRPASWLSTYFDRTFVRYTSWSNGSTHSNRSETLPVSSEERWRRELESESGFVFTEITYEWRLFEDRIRRAYSATYLIGRDGIETIVDDSFRLPKHVPLGSENSFSWNVQAIDKKVDPPETVARYRSPSLFERFLAPDEPFDERFGADEEIEEVPELVFDKDVRTSYQGDVSYDDYVLLFSSRSGSFDPGTSIRVEVEAELMVSPTEFTGDRFVIDHPCADVELLIDYVGDFDTVCRPRLAVFNPVHEKIPGSEGCETIRLDVRSSENWADRSTYSEHYPRNRSRYELTWDVTS